MITIRPASITDAPAISHVHVEGWRTTYRGVVADAFLDGLSAEARVPRWRQQLTSDARFFVAEKDGDLVGFISGGVIREPCGDYDAELFAIYLLSEARRTGIGKQLFHTLVNRLHADDFKSLMVWVLDKNPSRPFYEHMGGLRLTGSTLEISGEHLPMTAYGWPSLAAIAGQ